MPLEFDALVRRQLVVTVARDEVDELLTRDVRLGGQAILPLNVGQSDRQLGGDVDARSLGGPARQSVRPHNTP